MPLKCQGLADIGNSALNKTRGSILIHEQVYSLRNRRGELCRATENVYQASYTKCGPVTALGWVCHVCKECLSFLFDLCVRQGAGISVFIQVDLFLFSLVIVKKQNKTSCEPFGTSGKVPLLRIAESEKSWEQSWKPLLHSPSCLGCVWVPTAPQDAVSWQEAVPGQSAK